MVVHHPVEGEIIFIVLTRVLEHSSAFFLVIAQYCLGQLDMTQVAQLTPIQDGPKQMKSLLVLGTMSTHWMTKYELMVVEPTYFCPKHNKSKADAIMGTLSSVLRTASTKVTLRTLDEV